MKYFKKVFIWAILVSIILIIFIMRQDEIIMAPYDGDRHIKIDNKEILIFNEGEEKLDTYILEEKIKGYAIGDIDGDKLDELVLLTKGRMNRWGKEIVIFKLGQKIEEIYREDFSKLKPWKVAVGDIDGDGKSEVSIGVYKKTQFHDVMAKRPFIYSYEGHRLVPKWKGSRLSKPFIDYIFYDIDEDGMDEIISIEVLENKEKVVNTYKWEGFGFQGFLQSRSFIDIRNLRVIDGSIYVQIEEKGDAYIGELKIKNNNLIIERVNIR